MIKCRNAIYPDKCKSCGSGMLNFEEYDRSILYVLCYEFAKLNGSGSCDCVGIQHDICNSCTLNNKIKGH
jgi:hypothetical protein